MTVAEWLGGLRQRNVELWFEGERLRFRAPKGALTAEERASLGARRAEIVAHLRAEAAAGERTAPLSFSQQSLWFLQQQAPASAAYHVALTTRIESPVDDAALRQALQALVDRHPSLRTTYAVAGGAPVQRIAGAAAVAFEVRDAAGQDDAALRAAVEADYRRPFDLEAGPILRVSLHRRGPADHVLLFTVHHIAADGWSLMVLLDELLKLYGEATGGPPAALPRPALEYADYARWQQELLAGPEGERLWSAWRERLTPVPAPADLPGDHPRPAEKSFRGASLPIRLPVAASEGVKALARQEGTTPFVVLLAAIQAFTFRLTGARDVVVGTPTFARSRPEFMRIVGDFVNSVPLRGRPDPALPFRAFLGQLRQVVVEALAAQELPLPLLVRRLQLERDPSRSPLFETFFVLQRFDQFKDLQGLLAGGGPEDAIAVGGLRLAPFPLDQQEGQFDLAVQLVEQGGQFHGVLKYAADLFEEGTVRRWADALVALVEAAVRDPGVTLGALPGAAAAREGAGAEGAAALLERLRARDIQLRLDGDRLRVNAPKGALDDGLKALIAARRDALVEALRRAPGGDAAAAPRRIPRDGPLPVSTAQQRLWSLDRADPGAPHLRVAAAARLRGAVDEAVLRPALDALVAHHEALRTRLIERDGAPALRMVEPGPASLEVADLRGLPPDARAAEARRRADAFARGPLDLARGPVAAFLACRVADDEVHLAVLLHRAVADRASAHLLLGELAGIAAGPLAAPPLQAVDAAAWEREQLRSGRMGPHLAWWRKELEGAPAVLELPTDRPRPARATGRGRRLSRALDPAVLAALARLARGSDATLEAALLAAFEVLLHRHSGQEEVVVGSPVAGRGVADLAGVAGPLENPVVLRARLGGNPAFADVVAQAGRAGAAARDHAELPFEVLVDGLRPERTADRAPVFQARFAPAPAPLDAPAGAPFGAALLEAPDCGGAQVDLALELSGAEGHLVATFEYATDLFDEATIARLHDQLAQLLRAAAADPQARIDDLPLLTPAEERLLEGWNATALEHDRGRCLHHLLEASARATPDAPAVTAGPQTLGFRALDERASRLAQLLVRRGVKPGGRVAVCLDRTADLPVAVAAVLKAGAAYVPLDPTHPADRLRYVLEDAGTACGVTLARFAPILEGARTPLVLLDDAGAEAELASLPASAPPVPVRPEDVAYVMYTSGSTGRPKGVEVEHRNVVAFVEAMRREPGFGPRDVLLAVTTLSFDIAGLELWLPMATGGRIVIASRTDVLDGERLAALVQEHGVTMLQATPATWRLLLGAGWPGKRDLKALCGGEALPRDLAQALVGCVGELWNMYGPTETTIWSTLDRVTDGAAPITVGHPIQNTRVYVVERWGRLAPIGVAGELCIAGEGVARGYRERPELTAEKFTDLELPGGRRERVYRTGDVARIRSDGRIDFLGRRDHQVKVRGHRIELGEIEAVLASHPGVKTCVVTVREDTPGDVRIVGYVVPAAGAALDAEAARGTLRAKLPEYMVPNLFVELPALPLTPSGKIDRKVLPAPAAAPAQAGDPGDAHMTPVQRQVAAAWREVLRVDRVGLHDNFFDLGGHSLLLVKLHATLRRELQCDLALVELFQWTTVAAQAARVAAAAPPDSALRRAQARAARQTDG